MKQGIIYRVPAGPFRYNAWPTVCIDENENLYVACSGDRTSHICPFGRNLMFKSTDGGETWSLPTTVNNTWMDDRDAGLCYMGRGKMLLSWFSHPASFYYEDPPHILRYSEPFSRNMTMAMCESLRELTPEQNKYGSFIRLSDDYGASWGEQIKIPLTSLHGPNLSSDGSLIHLGRVFHSDIANKDHICFTKSRDGGKTWELLSVLPLPDDFVKDVTLLCEPDVLELPNGDLLGSIRVQQKGRSQFFTIYFTHSTDGGRTWSVPTPTGISGSPPQLLLLSDGRILCTYARREAPCGIHAVIVEDMGKRLSKEFILWESEVGDTNGDCGYPSTVELSDGSLVTVFYGLYKDDIRTSILYTKWHVNDLS